MSTVIINEILQYAGRGWHVFPLHGVADGKCTCGKDDCITNQAKHPRTLHGLTDATTDEEEIRKWWSMWPDSNVAIITGLVSGIIVLDIDPRHGGDGSLEELTAKCGALPETVECLTGGGGRHIYFNHPGGLVPNKAGIMPGLDVRGDGGYVVAPPSKHISGGVYEWELSSVPGEIEPADCPAWLLQKMQTKPKQGKEGATDGHISGRWP